MPPANKRKALGKGLSALIPQKKVEPPPISIAPEDKRKGIVKAAIEDVHPNQSQPRKRFDEPAMNELVSSIKEHGMMQPILVREYRGGFEIIAGERRWRACQKAGLKNIDVIVKDLADGAVFEWALVENIQREDLNPIEEAEAYRRLADERGLSQEQIAARVSKDRSTIANSLRLLKLPGEVRRQVISGALSMGHARALLSLDSADQMIKMSQKIIKDGLSVREVERMVRAMREAKSNKSAEKESDPYAQLPGGAPAVKRVTDELIKLYGTRVRIAPHGRKGKIEIEYASPEELDRLVTQLKD